MQLLNPGMLLTLGIIPVLILIQSFFMAGGVKGKKQPFII
jgi:hypothetical protein